MAANHGDLRDLRPDMRLARLSTFSMAAPKGGFD
jgi:hypothetical protein